MEFKSKMLIVALAAAMPWMSANAQSQADLQKEIAALRTQLQVLQQKVEAMNAAPAAPAANVVQQVNRLEQRLDLADDEKEKSGLKDLVVKGVVSAVYTTDDLSKINTFRSSDGNDLTAYRGAAAMVELTKHHEGSATDIDWTVRLTPLSDATTLVHEASFSIPVMEDGSRLIGGKIPDWTGYEYGWANQNPLVSHNALFEYASATAYEGFGMQHPLYNQGGQTLGLKWVVGNIDSGNDFRKNTSGDTIKSTGLAYRFDWTLSEYLSLGYAANIGNGSRNWQIHEVDGGYIRGDWTFNGMLTWGVMNQAAKNTDPVTGANQDASWAGVSLLAGYKLTPRFSVIGRYDFIDNRVNGGGLYGANTLNSTYGSGATSSGFGLDSNGVDGANLARISLGTNYQITPNAQWKLEYRLDKSTGDNFVDADGVAQSQKRTLATAVVWAF